MPARRCKQRKQYWRNQPNAFPSALDPLPPNLSALQIITKYPNHLEDRDVILRLVDKHDLNCGQIYDAMPAVLKKIGNRKLDVDRLNHKAHCARGGRRGTIVKSKIKSEVDTKVNSQVDTKTSSQTDQVELKEAPTPIVAHFPDPAPTIIELPAGIRETVAKGVVLGAKLEHFTAMARLVRGQHVNKGEEGIECVSGSFNQ